MALNEGSVSTPPDGVTLQDTGGILAIKDDGVTTAKILDANVTGAKRIYDIERVELFPFDFKVITGNAFLLNFGASWLNNQLITQNTAAINDEIRARFFLKAGNYTLHIAGKTDTLYGIATYYVDTVSQGSLDWYTGGAVNNVIKTIPITVVGSGWHTLNIKVASKNVSSSNYYMGYSQVWID